MRRLQPCPHVPAGFLRTWRGSLYFVGFFVDEIWRNCSDIFVTLSFLLCRVLISYTLGHCITSVLSPSPSRLWITRLLHLFSPGFYLRGQKRSSQLWRPGISYVCVCVCVWIDIHVLPCLQLTLPLSGSHRRHVLFSGKKKNKNQSGIIFCKFRTYFFFSNLGTLLLLKPTLWTDGAPAADLDTVSVGFFFF